MLRLLLPPTSVPGSGDVPCRVLDAVGPERLVDTVNGTRTLTWTAVAGGPGTRVPPRLAQTAGQDVAAPR